MARFRIDLEYVGTRYSGWQVQKNARTVQGALHEAVRAVAKRTDFESYGAGRTDAGVHALQQVAHLDLESRLPAETLRRGLNDELPADINLLRVEKVARQFHARHSAVARAYLYQIARRRTAFGKPFVWWIKDPLDVATPLPAETLRRRVNDELPSDINVLAADAVPHRFHARHHAVARRYLYQLSRRRTAFAKPFVWWVKDPLDLGAMRDAARALLGMNDYARFAERDEDDDDGRERSTVVLVERFEIVEDGALVLVMIEGSHFLWKMVRRLVGALVETGRGHPMPDDPARFTAPPSGLFLEHVFYAGDRRDLPIRAVTPCR